MNRTSFFRWAAGLAVCLPVSGLQAQEPRPEGAIDFEQIIAGARGGGARRAAPSPFRDFNEVTRGAEKTISTPRSCPTSSTSR
jgi:hypothetical protein